MKRLRLAVLEPYYGGSHAAFVDAWVARSRHHIVTATLPPRKWKWRMRGAAWWFARQATDWQRIDGESPDAIVCNDMLSAADLRALLPRELVSVPLICYFHENQLTYPLGDETQRDYHFGMTNITSCLASDAVWFNSMFHLESFVGAAEALLRKMPDSVPTGFGRELRDKATVLYPPVSMSLQAPRSRRPGDPATILWCHRWEYDKNPEPFFAALIRLIDAGLDYRLVLTGEQFREAPSVFADAWGQLQSRIDHVGFVSDRAAFENLLRRCDIVVSTTIQENFGIAVVEAVLAGCRPLLPARLAYPEVIPPEHHERCLYTDDEALLDRLADILKGDSEMAASAMADLGRNLYDRFGAEACVKRLDEATDQVVWAKTARNGPKTDTDI